MNALSRFGMLLISASAIGILLLKLFNYTKWFTNTWFYTDLTALSVLFGVVVAIAVVLVLNSAMKNIWIIIITFFAVLLFMYLLIGPAYMGGI